MSRVKALGYKTGVLTQGDKVEVISLLFLKAPGEILSILLKANKKWTIPSEIFFGVAQLINQAPRIILNLKSLNAEPKKVISPPCQPQGVSDEDWIDIKEVLDARSIDDVKKVFKYFIDDRGFKKCPIGKEPIRFAVSPGETEVFYERISVTVWMQKNPETPPTKWPETVPYLKYTIKAAPKEQKRIDARLEYLRNLIVEEYDPQRFEREQPEEIFKEQNRKSKNRLAKIFCLKLETVATRSTEILAKGGDNVISLFASKEINRQRPHFYGRPDSVNIDDVSLGIKEDQLKSVLVPALVLTVASINPKTIKDEIKYTVKAALTHLRKLTNATLDTYVIITYPPTESDETKLMRFFRNIWRFASCLTIKEF